MATLHLVNRGGAGSDALAACLGALAAGDGLLLIEDGVFAAAGEALGPLPDGVTLMVLDADAQARGVAGRLRADAKSIDHAGFVDACTRHDRVVTWS